MKKLLIALLISAASLTFAESWNVTVSTTNTTIVPAWTKSAAAWGTNTYAAGSTVLDAGKVYWTIAGGTSTNQPSTNIDAVDWIRLPTKPWKQVWISGDTASAVNVNVNGAAVQNTGYVLDDTRSRIHMPENFSGSVNGVAQSGTATIGVTTF